MTVRSALLVAAFDSQLKWAAGVRGALEQQGFSCRTVIPSDVPSGFSEQQLLDYGGASGVESLTWDQLLAQAKRVDVVVLSVQGSFVSRFCHELHEWSLRTGERGPITVSGWVGVVLREVTAGYLDRCATDVIAVNSRSDERTFSAVAARLGIPTDNLVLSGLPLLAGSAHHVPDDGPIGTVLYADQPTMPSARRDRLYIYQRLVDYARAHPDRTVVLKPRTRPGEETIHRMRFHPEVLLEGVELPANFSIDYTPIVERLATLDLMLTVSSTAALEAVGAGVRTAFVSDLGVREPLGNHIFLGSGLLRTFDQISADDLGKPEPDWVDDYFVAVDDVSPVLRLAARVIELLESGDERPGEKVRRSTFFASQYELFDWRREQERIEAAMPRPRFTGLRRRGRLLGQALLPSRRLLDRLGRNVSQEGR
ncbi:DUF6716 putative glycosyltransferase [Spongisporangium articulatum]|uniref:DUF6716 putative glycosyltransferase n=1 Tax=Spongisporangium articulatum TaxID=3362603 RepID=A0ABW8AH26_9ACTN